MDAATWNARYAEAELVWSAGPNTFVEELCGQLAPGRSIDLAAGEGRNAIWLAEQGWDSTAVDYSAVAIDKARRIAANRGVTITTEVADLTEYEPTPGGYDLVLVAYLQLPDEQLIPILGTAATAVAAGGTFLLVCHDRENLARGHGGPRDPAVLTTPDQVVRALGDRFAVARSEVAERRVHTVDGDRVALDTLVLARRQDDPEP